MIGEQVRGKVAPDRSCALCPRDQCREAIADQVASYSEQIQRLLGRSAGSNHMGWVEVDGQMIDPTHLLGDWMAHCSWVSGR